MKKLFLLLAVLCCFSADVFCCTSAIITGKLTPDGRPLMWKHRDTGQENNRIQYFKGEKYSFLALMDSPVTANEVWTGINSAGFCIMNTASYNLKDDDVKESDMDKEGEVMYKALSTCRTLKDFEKLLDQLKRPMGVEANFGVIDAEGGAAYYEVNNRSWTKVDVNDPKVAPQGYLIYTNHSYTGRLDEGMGYIRYTTANEIFRNRLAAAASITPAWIFSNLSRSFRHSLLGMDLVKDGIAAQGSGWFIDQDFIPRKSSSASIVMQGVKPGENPINTVMWTMLGYPPVSVAVPLFIAAGENQPGAMLKTSASMNAPMCDMALQLKKNVFPIVRGNGNKYFNFSLLYNAEGTGYMQVLAPVEKQVLSDGCKLAEELRQKGYDKARFDNYYEKAFESITAAYARIFDSEEGL